MPNKAQHKLLEISRMMLALRLPPQALKVWTAYLMEGDEDWISSLGTARVAALTGNDLRTVTKWTRLLVEHGWLIRLGCGAHNATTYRVASQPSTNPNQ